MRQVLCFASTRNPALVVFPPCLSWTLSTSCLLFPSVTVTVMHDAPLARRSFDQASEVGLPSSSPSSDLLEGVALFGGLVHVNRKTGATSANPLGRPGDLHCRSCRIINVHSYEQSRFLALREYLISPVW